MSNLLVGFFLLGVTCFAMTLVSMFWDVFHGTQGKILHAIMFCCEMGVLTISLLSIREAVRSGTFQVVGTFQNDTRFLIFSVFLTFGTTIVSIVGLDGFGLLKCARVVNKRLNAVLPETHIATASRSKPNLYVEEEHELQAKEEHELQAKEIECLEVCPRIV